MRSELRLNEPMAKHVSWRAGGVARQAYVPADLADLAAFLKSLPADEPLLFVGLGSNLLVRDGGFKGTVILMHAVLNTVRLEGERIYAEAGVASPKLARFAAKHDFAGAEFLAGIPGTVGGALAMNAGCYGAETWESVDEVLTINRRGELQQRKPNAYEIGYRHVVLKVNGERLTVIEADQVRTGNHRSPITDHAEEVNGERLTVIEKDQMRDDNHRSPITDHSEEWFIAAWFKFQSGDGKAAQQRIKELLQKRIASQPLQQPNAGSVFRNPPQDYAARLIEASGLKGKRCGHAQVSEKHANFIVNCGGATAADIEGLISMVQETVQREQGILLVPEVRIVGDSVSGSGVNGESCVSNK